MTRTTTMRPIGLSAPYVDETEEELVLEVIRSGRLAFGPMIEQFEEALAERVEAPYVAAVSSGTAGLHLCMKLAGIEPGDEVVTTPLSFIASANAIVYEGGVPVFVDVDERTLNLAPAAVEAAITPRTKALVLVDLFGYPLELDVFHELAARHGLAIIEDACEALGSTYRGRPIGSFGNPAVFAFYPNKQVTTGEGGAVALGTEAEWELVKSLANHGRIDRGETFAHARIGYNYRLDELSAALGVAQLRKLDRILALRDEVAARYDALLADVEGVRLLCPDDDLHRRSWFVYVVLVQPPVDRSRGDGSARCRRDRVEAVPARDSSPAGLPRPLRVLARDVPRRRGRRRAGACSALPHRALGRGCRSGWSTPWRGRCAQVGEVDTPARVL